MHMGRPLLFINSLFGRYISTVEQGTLQHCLRKYSYGLTEH